MTYSSAIELRPYQTKAIEQTRAAIANGARRPVLVAPTGSGKTYMAAEIIRLAGEKRSNTFFMCHRRELVFQASDKLNHLGVPHGILMAGETRGEMEPVQVASIQTYWSRYMQPRKDFLPPCELMVIDECHQAVAQTWRSIIENYPEAVTLGLTATPIRGDKVGLGHIFDHMIQTATISDLTEQGYLVPVRYFAPSMPDLRGVEVRMGDYVEAQLVERMQPLLGDIVENWSRICPDRQTIVFATGVRQSRHIAKRFEEIGVTSAHLDGKSSKSERDEVLKLFEGGEIQVLSNCQLFTHGWDSPPASCCILARPTKALGLYVQMVGRTLRPFEGKQDCIVIDHAGAVYQHGFVDDPMPWMLTCDGKLPSGKFQRRPSASKPICCENCKTVYSRTLACPNCGWEPEPGRELVAFEPAELQQVRRGAPRPHSYSMDDKRKWWAMLEGYRLQRGYKSGWSYYKYRDKFHVKPSSAVTSEEPMEPDGQVLGFIRSTQIRWAKSKQQKEGFRDGNRAGKKERAEEGRLWDRGPSETETNPGWDEGSI